MGTFIDNKFGDIFEDTFFQEYNILEKSGEYVIDIRLHYFLEYKTANKIDFFRGELKKNNKIIQQIENKDINLIYKKLSRLLKFKNILK